ncbi:porin [Robertkochia solimangrovi]|uniref:porin n=1 Tax=Robertkochia solimangrovi TaxID=2213046 RepID=UPI00117F6E33|nr:porin [Robertkochia solimangrovi]TRZ45929.1 porin [Robertkochia solimangrovi]
MKYLATVAGLLLMNLCVMNAQEVKAPKFGKGLLKITGKDSTWTMNFAARVQFLSSTTWNYADEEFQDPESNFLIRRARLKFDGFIMTPKLKYKLEFGLSNRDMGGTSVYTNNVPRFIMDAVIKWNFYENFELWVGQTKLPGNIERVISSANLQLVDRSIVNSLFNIDRDMGLQLHHHTNIGNSVLREIVSVSQGEGRNVTVGNLGGHQFTGRLEFLPFGLFTDKGDYFGADLKREQSPKLLLGATYDMNMNAVRTRSNMGSYMETDYGWHETDINTLFLDMMFKYRGFSFMGEYANRDADDPFARNSDGSLTGDIVQVGKGFNLQSGYLFKSNWEVAGRFSQVNLDKSITGKGIEDQYTLGVSKYIVGHKFKVQSDVTYINLANNNDRLMFRIQMDVHF